MADDISGVVSALCFRTTLSRHAYTIISMYVLLAFALQGISYFDSLIGPSSIKIFFNHIRGFHPTFKLVLQNNKMQNALIGKSLY